jgi:hypothetical protein
MLGEKHAQEAIMATGLYRVGSSAQVSYGSTFASTASMPKKDYQKKGYKPDFDDLPSKEEYDAAAKRAKT